jgi:putative Holliday junction resolvase
MRRGVRLSLDLGQARIGIAKCDVEGILASPVMVSTPEQLETDLAILLEEYSPIEIVVGLPIDLRGNSGVSAENVHMKVAELVTKFPTAIFRMVDERMTTKVARSQLQASGIGTRADKKLIDAVAASVLLEDALEYERRNGEAPGQVWE